MLALAADRPADRSPAMLVAWASAAMKSFYAGRFDLAERLSAELRARPAPSPLVQAYLHQVAYLEAIRKADEEALMQVADVGPAVAQSIRAFFEETHNRRVLDDLERTGVRAAATPRPSGGSLEGKTFVFTGELESMSRHEAARRATEQGARVAPSVNRKVTHVVAGPGAGSKLAKAKELKLEILDEDQFLALLGGATRG